MMTFLFALGTAFIAALPQILTLIETAQAKTAKETDAIVQGDLDALAAGIKRLHKP